MFKKVINFFKRASQAVKDFFFKNRYGTVMLLVGITIAFWDLLFKFLLDGKTYSGVAGFFSIMSTHNTGGAWSIFSSSTTFLIVITIVFIVAMVVFNYLLKIKNYFYAISMGLFLSGAFCNLFDRLKYGYVRDFIKLEFINFPIFNIADIAITVGVVLLCVYLIFIMPKLEKKKIANNIEIASQDKQEEEIQQKTSQTAEIIEQNDDKKTEATVTEDKKETRVDTQKKVIKKQQNAKQKDVKSKKSVKKQTKKVKNAE